MTHPNSQPTLPLWRVIEDAFIKGRQPGHSDPHGYAAELRAIVGAIEDHFVMLNGDSSILIRDWLLSEADRAERGEE